MNTAGKNTQRCHVGRQTQQCANTTVYVRRQGKHTSVHLLSALLRPKGVFFLQTTWYQTFQCGWCCAGNTTVWTHGWSPVPCGWHSPLTVAARCMRSVAGHAAVGDAVRAGGGGGHARGGLMVLRVRRGSAHPSRNPEQQRSSMGSESSLLRGGGRIWVTGAPSFISRVSPD